MSKRSNICGLNLPEEATIENGGDDYITFYVDPKDKDDRKHYKSLGFMRSRHMSTPKQLSFQKMFISWLLITYNCEQEEVTFNEWNLDLDWDWEVEILNLLKIPERD